MLLPSKHIPVSDTYLGVGGVILHELKSDMPVKAVWSRVRNKPTVGSYDRFLYSLTLLNMFGLVEYVDGTIRKVAQ